MFSVDSLEKHIKVCFLFASSPIVSHPLPTKTCVGGDCANFLTENLKGLSALALLACETFVREHMQTH